ncbi:MAG TPA: hypothetical protein VLC46_03450 [Thermoanaerobaculia bacterium]|jgi:hypothetical protein|nr:hypothetical protein [Thermoanaerobaculia bacterium]
MRVRRLFKPKAFFGWVLFIWSAFGFMSTLQFVINAGKWLLSLLPPVVPWLSTVSGRLTMFFLGLGWLAVIAWGPEDVGKMSDDDLKALQILGSKFKNFRARELADAMSESPQQALSHIDRLKKLGYACRSVRELLKGDHGYAITEDGRTELKRRNCSNQSAVTPA